MQWLSRTLTGRRPEDWLGTWSASSAGESLRRCLMLSFIFGLYIQEWTLQERMSVLQVGVERDCISMVFASS